MASRPNFFIIGAAKAGTTSLYEYLRGHPDIYMSPRKSPRYFAPDLATEGVAKNLRHGEDREEYLALFHGARDEKRVGEASVRYIYSSEAPTLIHEFDPAARIVAILRSPVDMIHSLHNQRVSSGAEPIADFELVLAAEDDRRKGIGIPLGSAPILSLYRDRGRYGQQLPRWFDTFGRQNVHVMIFEDFVREPAKEFRRLLEFLQVDPDYQPESFAVHNKSHQPQSRLLRSLLRSRPVQWFLWRLLPGLRVDRLARAAISPVRRFNRKPAERSPLGADLRARLEADFRDDVEALSALLDRDLAGLWFRHQPATQVAQAASGALAQGAE